jgi:hypothetical protein
MSDRHAMPYMTPEDCRSIGCEPYAIYGGKVYSFKDQNSKLVPHGTQPYRLAHEEARATQLMRMASFAGARGA